jgi:hypothetical protein
MADNKIVTMRKLTGAVFQLLDGVIQAPGGPQFAQTYRSA